MDEQENGVPRWAVRIETKLAELETGAERSYQHLTALQVQVGEIRDLIKTAQPRLDDHTGRITLLETQHAAQADRLATWKGISSGIVLVCGAGAVVIGIILTVLQLTR